MFPKFVIDSILDEINFTSDNIINKKILIFNVKESELIMEVYKRIIDSAIFNHENINKQLNNIYLNYINSDIEYKLNELFTFYNIKKYNINNIQNIDKYSFDFIVSIPINKNNNRCDNEITELTEAYNKLSKDGKMSFLLSSTSLTNNNSNELRNQLIKNQDVKKIIDFKNNLYGIVKYYEQNNILLIIDKNYNNSKIIYQINSTTEMIDGININLNDFINKPWQSFGADDQEFNEIISNRKHKLGDICDVYYKIHTGCNPVFTGIVENSKIHMTEIEEDLLYPLYSIKTANKNKKIIFPYKKIDGVYCLINEDDFKEKYPKTYKYLSKSKTQLKKRNLQGSGAWYKYSRNIYPASLEKDFLIFNSNISLLQKKVETIKMSKGVIVSSGYYVCAKEGHSLEKIKKIIESEDFAKYIKINGKANANSKLITAELIKNYKYN